MLMNKKKKKENPELDEKTADQMLENILEACGAEPKSIPLSELTSYSSYRKGRFLLQKVLVASILLFLCLVQVLFVSPDIELTRKNESSNENPSYELEVDTPLPVSRITASINGKSTPIFETENDTYSIKPVTNGVMIVTVTLKNRQSSTETIEVTGVDTAPPNILSNKTIDNSFYLYLSDPDSGIDYEKITASDAKGNAVQPITYSESENYVVFGNPNTLLDIYIPDKTGNTLHLILTVR